MKTGLHDAYRSIHNKDRITHGENKWFKQNTVQLAGVVEPGWLTGTARTIEAESQWLTGTARTIEAES